VKNVRFSKVKKKERVYLGVADVDGFIFLTRSDLMACCREM